MSGFVNLSPKKMFSTACRSYIMQNPLHIQLKAQEIAAAILADPDRANTIIDKELADENFAVHFAVASHLLIDNDLKEASLYERIRIIAKQIQTTAETRVNVFLAELPRLSMREIALREEKDLEEMGQDPTEIERALENYFSVIAAQKNEPLSTPSADMTDKQITTAENGKLEALAAFLSAVGLKNNSTETYADYELRVNKEKRIKIAKSVLMTIKKRDIRTILTTPPSPTTSQLIIPNTYELRRNCLQRSGGAISTLEAYTYKLKVNLKDFEGQGLNSYDALIAFAKNESEYLPERSRYHATAIANYAIKMMQLSKELNLPKRTIFCIGGNLGAGKSHYARNSSLFSSINPKNLQGAVMSPDDIKTELRRHDLNAVSSYQTHFEGIALSEKIRDELRNKALGICIAQDETFSWFPVLEDALYAAIETGSRFEFHDIEVPLPLSCLRMLSRDEKTGACPPFNIPANNYRALHDNRRKKIAHLFNEVRRLPNVPEFVYQLMVPVNGKYHQAWKITNEGEEANPALLARAKVEITERELKETGNTIITENLIESYDEQGIDKGQLSKYIGKTIAAALEERSRLINEIRTEASPGKTCPEKSYTETT